VGDRVEKSAMAESYQKVSELRRVILPVGHAVKPDDVGTAVVEPAIPISKVLGFSEFHFNFFNEGGPDNLKPGRPTTQTASFTPPPGGGGDVVSVSPG